MVKNSTNKKTSINGSANNAVTYSGSVNVKIKKNGKTIKSISNKNSGTVALLYALAQAVSWKYTRTSMPAYITCSTDTSDIANVTITSSTAKYSSTANEAYATFQATVTYQNIDSSEINVLKLKDANETELAEVELETAIDLASPDYVAIIMWTMTFKDSSKEESE